MNINEINMGLGKARSVIRETFEYGNARAAEVGRENVFDFSLGNPSVPAPACIDETISRLTDGGAGMLHGYTSAQGAFETRKAVADSISRSHGIKVSPDDIYMTCGAAASLTISLHALCNTGDEVIVIAPFFPEYLVFANGAGARTIVVPADTTGFQIDFEALSHLITPKTKAVIINSPNNPSGAVLTEACITELAGILRSRSEKYGHPVYLIADEPYRELVYDNARVPYITKYYDNTLVCYSYSKSLSLPGERIGYIHVNGSMQGRDDVYAAVCGAGRALGYVCAPALMQKVIALNPDAVSDLSVYKTNRSLLYESLSSYGYECVRPDGAFYLLVKSSESDANAFCERARGLDLLLVPSDSFGCPGYARISYCVSTEMITRALPLFKRLLESYR